MSRKPKDADIEFAKSTSLHGVQHLVQQSLVYKIGWCLLIIGAVTLCVWQISDRVRSYFSYQTAKEYNEINANNMTFPTVTFCSSYNTRDNILTEKDRTILQLSTPHYKLWDNFEVLTEDDLEYFNNNYWKIYKNQTNLLYPKGFNFTDILLRNAYKLTNETLLVCQFNFDYCFEESLFFLLTLEFELCWSFNSHLNEPAPLIQESNGPDYGLITIIDLQRDAHTTTFQHSLLSKFNLYLSPYGEVPLGFSDAIPVTPGKVTHIKLDYTQNKHLPSPYGPCKENQPLPPYGTNTIQNCFAKCYIDNCKEYAGCHPFIYSDFVSNSGNFCDFIDIFLLDLGHKNNFDEIPFRDCSYCASPCIEEKYTATVYYTEPFNNVGIKNLMKVHNVTQEYIDRNYLILNVFFDNFVYHVTEEKAVMTVASLLSDIGGALGLFMGMSILTLAEIVGYLAQRCKLCVNAKRGYTQGKTNEGPKDIELKGENNEI